MKNSTFKSRRSFKKHVNETVSAKTVEPGILPLVEVLNKKGFVTIASCEGHNGRNNTHPPYVLFRVNCMEKLAAKVFLHARPLFQTVEVDYSDFHGGEVMTLRYKSWSRKYPENECWCDGLTREEVDADIRLLAAQIEKL